MNEKTRKRIQEAALLLILLVGITAGFVGGRVIGPTQAEDPAVADLRSQVAELQVRVDELELENDALHEEIGAAWLTVNQLEDLTWEQFREVFEQLEEGDGP